MTSSISTTGRRPTQAVRSIRITELRAITAESPIKSKRRIRTRKISIGAEGTGLDVLKITYVWFTHSPL